MPDRYEYTVYMKPNKMNLTMAHIFSIALSKNCHQMSSIRLVNHTILTRLCMSLLKYLSFDRKKGKMALCRKWVEMND